MDVLAAFMNEPSPPTPGGDFVFNIAPVTGAEGSPRAGMPPPGMLPPKAAQLMKLQQLATRLGVDPDMSSLLTPEKASSVRARLDAIHEAGELTPAQYDSVRALIDAATAPAG